MLTFTINELKENSQFIQQQAEIEPVVIANPKGKQIFIKYEDYLNLLKKNAIQQPSISAYDYFDNTLAKHFTDEELHILAEIEDDADMSLVGQS